MGQLLYSSLSELYDSERRLVSVIPEILHVFTTPGLREVCSAHLEICRHQLKQIEPVMETEFENHSKVRSDVGATLVSQMLEKISERSLLPAVRQLLVLASFRKLIGYQTALSDSCRSLAKTMRLPRLAGIISESTEQKVDLEKTLAYISANELLSHCPRARGVSTVGI
ncbi:MAG: DUF892 family protein [Deltaproteobacteria bacterium]|nr:DUF892 family protein [Deltaproteobacteria bacterium]